MQIETFDNLLVSSPSWLAKRIQWFQHLIFKKGYEYNHSGLMVWISGVLFVCEADRHGIALTPFSNYIKSNKKLLILKPKSPINDETKEKFVKFILPYCGHTPYEFINLLFYQPVKLITMWLAIGANKLIRKKKLNEDGLWIGRKEEKSDKKFICGEWTTFNYNVFFRWFEGIWNSIAPSKIFEAEYFHHCEVDKETLELTPTS